MVYSLEYLLKDDINTALLRNQAIWLDKHFHSFPTRYAHRAMVTRQIYEFAIELKLIMKQVQQTGYFTSK